MVMGLMSFTSPCSPDRLDDGQFDILEAAIGEKDRQPGPDIRVAAAPGPPSSRVS